jgi:primosomal protein N' (replication factor Y)
MQIVKVVPKVTTSDEGIFDYAIPPGLLPDIKIGLLVLVPFRNRLVEGIIIDIKSSSKILHLKSIVKIIDPIPVIDETHIKLAKWISVYYISPLSKCIFENIVPPAIRLINLTKPVSTTINYARAKILVVKNKPKLVIGDFKNRLECYKDSIQKCLKNNKSVIILVPDLSLIKYFNLPNAAVLHGGLSRTERWIVWNNIRSGKNRFVIGSTSALFAPLYNLGLIIIDQEESETYKNDRSPRYHAIRAAKELAKLTSSNLILGSLTPSINSYFDYMINNSTLTQYPDDAKREISIVNLVSEKNAVSVKLENEMVDAFKKNKKTVLFIEKKGDGEKFVGITTGYIKKYIKQILPNAKIISIENGISEMKNSNWDVAIATSYALKFSFPKIQLVGIIDADLSLGFPDYLSQERSFRKLYKFIKIGEKVILQTRLPESNFINSLAKLSFDSFYKNEILTRKKYNYPPFYNVIKIVYKDTDEENCKLVSNKIYKRLTNEFGDIIISESSPAFISKRNKYFRYQIILRTKKAWPQELTIFLKKLGKGWIVDVDPIDLL